VPVCPSDGGRRVRLRPGWGRGPGTPL